MDAASGGRLASTLAWLGLGPYFLMHGPSTVIIVMRIPMLVTTNVECVVTSIVETGDAFICGTGGEGV